MERATAHMQGDKLWSPRRSVQRLAGEYRSRHRPWSKHHISLPSRHAAGRKHFVCLSNRWPLALRSSRVPRYLNKFRKADTIFIVRTLYSSTMHGSYNIPRHCHTNGSRNGPQHNDHICSTNAQLKYKQSETWYNAGRHVRRSLRVSNLFDGATNMQ